MLLFKPRGVTSNDPKYAGNPSIMTLQDLLAYRDTWTERLSDDFSLGNILQRARSEKNKPVVPEKLIMTENGFKVKGREEIDEAERAVRMVQSTLNKLTKSNFDVLVKPILTPEIVLNDYVVNNIVRLIYEKALVEPFFVGLYASLCHEISICEHKHRNETKEKGSKRRVQVAIVEKCQEMFEKARSAVSQSLSKEDAEKLHKRNVTNIKFTGELFLKELVTVKVMKQILDTNLNNGLPSEADLEVVINLLEVVGKMYAEKDPSAQEELWKKLGELHENRTFSNRIRFLLQNLIDRRNGGWEPRASEIVDTPDPKAEQQQQQQMTQPMGDPASGRGMHHPHHQRNSNGPMPPDMGKRVQSYQDLQSPFNTGQRRVTSCNDLSSSLPPPPPTPGPAPGSAKEQNLENEAKTTAYARPPEALTPGVQTNIINIVRDFMQGGKTPRTLLNRLDKTIPGENGNACLMSSVYVILHECVTLPDESKQKVFLDALIKGGFEKTILCRGFAWCLTRIISDRRVEDCPKVYSRFVSATVSVAELDFISVVKDIMVRTAKYLDSILYEHDNTDEWEEDFIHVWDILLSTWKQKRNLRVVRAAVILESIASVPPRSFMQNITPDFIAEMMRTEIFTEEQFKEWRCQNESNIKYKSFMEEINQLFE